MKKIISLLLAVLLLCTAVGCSDGDYKDDVAANDLSKSVIESLGDEKTYSEDKTGYIEGYFAIPDYVSDYSIYYSTDANDINEIGVFHVKGEKPSKIVTILNQFLKDNLSDNETFYNSYIPEETPKLRDAEVKVFGNYVVYLILNDSDRTTAIEQFEQLLRK